jgi:hypothetical protein
MLDVETRRAGLLPPPIPCVLRAILDPSVRPSDAYYEALFSHHFTSCSRALPGLGGFRLSHLCCDSGRRVWSK